MAPPSGYLADNPLPPGIAGALGLNGYQLLAEVAGLGAGRLGSQVFLLVAPDPDPNVPHLGTQITLHNSRLRDESDVGAWTQLAAQIGYLRLSGYRVVLERDGLRSHLSLLNPATGGIALRVPARHPGRLFGSGGATAPRLLASLRALPPAGSPPDTRSPELLHQVVLALALQDPDIYAEQAVELADRAVELSRSNPALDPPAALMAAREQGAP
jgi:hypothetical protein